MNGVYTMGKGRMTCSGKGSMVRGESLLGNGSG